MITLFAEPQLYNPVYNDIGYIVNSDNVFECQFQYIAQVYVNGVLAVTLKQFPDPTTGYGLFKINRVLEDYISYDLHQNLWDFEANPNSIVKFQVKFGESYDDSATCNEGPTDYTDLYESEIRYAWNGCFQYEDFLDYRTVDFLPGVLPDTGRFLTNLPSGKVFIGKGDQMWISFLQNNFNCYAMVVETYDNQDSLINTYTFVNSVTYVPSTVSTHMVSFGIGPENLNNNSQFSTTVPITSQVDYYTFYLINSKSFIISEKLTLKIDKRCSKYDPFRVVFQNRLGGFDGYTFTMRHIETQSIQRVEWQRLLGRAISPYNSFPTYNVGDRGRTLSAVNATSKRNVISNWMTEEEVEWLQELYTSPEVYRMESNPIYRSYSTTSWDSPGKLTLKFTNYKNAQDFIDGRVFNIIIDKDDKTVNPSYDGIQFINDIPDQYTINVITALYGTPETLEGSDVWEYLNILNMYPVIVTDGDYQIQKKGEQQLLQVSLNIDDAYKKQVQRS